MLPCRSLFDSSLYQQRKRLARGAYANVFKCSLPEYLGSQAEVALKMIDLPGSLHDPCYQVTHL